MLGELNSNHLMRAIWARKLPRIGLDIFRVKAGKSVQFRIVNEPNRVQHKALEEIPGGI